MGMTWHLCRGGYHRWPDPLKASAARCCPLENEAGMVAPACYVPDYLCASGRHLWSRSTDALRCCNGYLPVWQTLGDAATTENPFEVRQMVLVPAAFVTAMNEMASRPEEERHLYRPM